MSHELYYHQQLILRLPSTLSENISHILLQNKPVDGVHIEVVYQEKSFFEFVYGEQRYPALLSNLPCNIETHKTFDHITYYKSGDISQMLYVFLTVEERDKCYQELIKNSMGQKCFPSGITAPTLDIIKKKFSKTRREKPHPPELVTQIEAEVTRYTVTEDIEEIYEEVVPFEKYMADAAHPEGNTFTFSSKIGSDLSIFHEHPEIMLTSQDDELRKKISGASSGAAPAPMAAPLVALSSTKKSDNTSSQGGTGSGSGTGATREVRGSGEESHGQVEEEPDNEDSESDMSTSSDDENWLDETTKNL